MNLSHILKRHVADNPDKTAIIFNDRRISYAHLYGMVNRAADGLLKMGLKPGDVLSLFMPSKFVWVIANSEM